eukprot:507621_1
MSSTSNSRKRKQPHTQPSDQPSLKRMRLASALSSNIQNAMKNSTFHDVEFVVGTGDSQETFSGSRIFYAIHSKVLEKMLYGSMQESISNNQVFIPDVSPVAFNYFHLLIYSQTPPLTYDIVIHVLYLAQKYLIEVLVSECKDYTLLVNKLTDFYSILNSFAYYPPSTFDSFLSQFLSKCKCIKTNIISKIMEHNKFMKLPIYMIQRILKSKLIPNEQSKYIHCKEYCKRNNDNNNWQKCFKQNFSNLIDFSRIKSDFLLRVIRADLILSNEQLLNIWEIKTKRDKPGFKIEELILSYDECIQLEPNDYVDIRCYTGEIVNARITDNTVCHSDSNCSANNIVHEICVVYNVNNDVVRDTPIQAFVSFDDQRVMINGCISKRKNGIMKICMQNLKINQNIFVNVAYLPSKSYGITGMSRWIKKNYWIL